VIAWLLHLTLLLDRLTIASIQSFGC
jgi:hypothetical protein